MRILVITPLQKEFNALVKKLETDFTGQRGYTGKIPVVNFPSQELTVALGGHGKVQFSLHVQYLLERNPDIDLVICAGVAGGLSDSVGPGDIVVGRQTIEHDYKEKFDKEPLPCFDGDVQAIAKLEQAQKILSKSVKLHFGLGACPT